MAGFASGAANCSSLTSARPTFPTAAIMEPIGREETEALGSAGSLEANGDGAKGELPEGFEARGVSIND